MKSFLLIGTLLCGMIANAQKQKFDIASFIPPNEWQRLDSNGVVLLQDAKTSNGQLTSFCQIFLYPSRESRSNATTNFKQEWNGRVAIPTGCKAKPVTNTGKTAEGWTVVTGQADITQQGLTYTCILLSASGYEKVMSVMVNVIGNEYLPVIDSFFAHMDLDAKKTIPANTDIYRYTAPERWYRQPVNGYTLLTQTQNAQSGCTISLLPPQVSSGDLEKDAKSLFVQLYPGRWKYRYTNPEKQYEIMKGFTDQGLPYCRFKAPMQKQRPDGYYYDYEDGDVLVITTRKQVAVIISRHNRGEMTCFCDHQYEYWPRFFNSLTIKGTSTTSNDANIANRLIGSWQSMGGSALVQYIFAANGHYQFIGAYSTTSRIDRYTIELKTSGFKGDGKYSISGSRLTTIKDGSKAEAMPFRLEQINFGGTGWTDRLYLRSLFDGKEYEVSYDKQKL